MHNAWSDVFAWVVLIEKFLSSTPPMLIGFHGDVLTLTKMIGVRMKMYEHEHGKKMSTKAIAAMLSTMLYYRCFGVLNSLFVMMSYILLKMDQR